MIEVEKDNNSKHMLLFACFARVRGDTCCPYHGKGMGPEPAPGKQARETPRPWRFDSGAAIVRATPPHCLLSASRPPAPDLPQ